MRVLTTTMRINFGNQPGEEPLMSLSG